MCKKIFQTQFLVYLLTAIHLSSGPKFICCTTNISLNMLRNRRDPIHPLERQDSVCCAPCGDYDQTYFGKAKTLFDTCKKDTSSISKLLNSRVRWFLLLSCSPCHSPTFSLFSLLSSLSFAHFLPFLPLVLPVIHPLSPFSPSCSPCQWKAIVRWLKRWCCFQTFTTVEQKILWFLSCLLVLKYIFEISINACNATLKIHTFHGDTPKIFSFYLQEPHISWGNMLTY